MKRGDEMGHGRREDAQMLRVTAPLIHWSLEGFHGLGFLTLTGEAAEALHGHALMHRLETGKRRGFGSVKVNVTLGGSRWSTSVFPQKDGSFFLPVKKAIQRAEGLEEGDLIEVELELL